MYRLCLTAILAALLSSCAALTPTASHAVFVSFVSKNIKFADMGFLNEFEKNKSLEVYSAGIPVFTVSFDNSVCVNSGCVDKADFVKEYISPSLYKDILDDILSQKQLKIDSNISRVKSGFIQTAVGNGYDIRYTVSGRSAVFVEKISGFEFAIRLLD